MASTHGTPSRQQPHAAAPAASGNSDGDVWIELFGTVKGLEEAVDLCMQAFGPDPVDKQMSATTKKRLLIKSVQGLKQSKGDIQVLTEHLKALKVASQQWQRSMLYASKSQEELMESLESTHRELDSTAERLRTVEAQRIAATREAEAQHQQLVQSDLQCRSLQAALKQREDDLETAQFSSAEAQAEMSHMAEKMEAMHAERETAVDAARRAVAALDAAKAEAAKATSSADRHQQVVAKLTADNLMFLMSLKKAEADLIACNQDRAQLRLAVEKQRGPWFDEVRTGVEERVRGAMQRAEALESELEATKAQHDEALRALGGQQADLEEFLGAVRTSEAALGGQLAEAIDARRRAEEQSHLSTSAAEALRAQLEALSAERRVLQDNVAAMRQECTEKWVSEQKAVGQVSGLQSRIADLSARLDQSGAKAVALQASVDAAAGVNRHLMQRKEEVEWQLMAAMAKLEGGTSHIEGQQQQPIPLNLMVSGMLQVDRRDQHKANERQQRAEQQRAEQQRQALLHLEQKTPSTTSLQYYQQQQGPTAAAAALTAASLLAVNAVSPGPGSPAARGSPVRGTSEATTGLSPARRVGGDAGFLYTAGGSPGPAAAVAAMLLERDASPSSPIRPPVSSSSQQYFSAGVPRPSPARAAAAYAHNAAASAHSAASSKWGSWGGGSTSSSAAALGPWRPSGPEQPYRPSGSGGGTGPTVVPGPSTRVEVAASPAKQSSSGGLVSYSGGGDDGTSSRDQRSETSQFAVAVSAPSASASAAASASQASIATAVWQPALSSPARGPSSSYDTAAPTAAASSRLLPESWAPPQYMEHQQRGRDEGAGGGDDDDDEARLRASLMTPSKRVSADLHMTSAPRA